MVIILIGHKSEKDPLKICYFHPYIISFLGKNNYRLCINAENKYLSIQVASLGEPMVLGK